MPILTWKTIAALFRQPGLGEQAFAPTWLPSTGPSSKSTSRRAVGKIIAVFPYSSQVMLITDPSSGAGALLEQARIQGILKGSGQSGCELHYVMNEDSVADGEMILTSGLDQVYPKGLPLGRVVSVGEGNIYKKIAVKPAAALDRLESVLVVLKPASDALQAQSAPTRP